MSDSQQFFMPPEWHPHDACWMAWPCRADLWPDMQSARRSYAAVAQAIAQFEPVKMLCRPEDEQQAGKLLSGDIEIITAPLDDSWARDTGPTFVINRAGDLAGVDWRFNGWGDKFLPYDKDAQLASLVLETLGVKRFDSRLYLEGGAIHTDGEGTLLTTRQCLQNANRNPDWSETEIETELYRLLGVKKVIWLDEGLIDDHTDGHIDELATFYAPGKVLALSSDNKDDGNYPILQSNLQRLRGSHDASGRRLEVLEVMQPEERRLPDGSRMSLSYINFYLANGGVVMAEFNQPDYDRAAKTVLQQAFPDREIVQIPALEIFEGGGGIHCITQQQPKVFKAN